MKNTEYRASSALWKQVPCCSLEKRGCVKTAEISEGPAHLPEWLLVHGNGRAPGEGRLREDDANLLPRHVKSGTLVARVVVSRVRVKADRVRQTTESGLSSLEIHGRA